MLLVEVEVEVGVMTLVVHCGCHRRQGRSSLSSSLMVAAVVVCFRVGGGGDLCWRWWGFT